MWRKRHPFLGRLIFYGIRAVVIFVLAVLGVAVFATVFSMLLYADLLVACAFLLLVLSVAAFILTKTPRKRLKFLRNLKKLCKKERYRLKRVRKFTRSFKWDPSAPDFILETGRHTYYCHFLTVNKYNSTLTFRSPEFIEKVSYPLDNKFTIIFEFKPKKKELRTNFKPLPENSSKKYVRAIILNPVCREMLETDKDGGLIATGNGMEKFGYSVFTGTGFTEAVKRNEYSHTTL